MATYAPSTVTRFADKRDAGRRLAEIIEVAPGDARTHHHGVEVGAVSRHRIGTAPAAASSSACTSSSVVCAKSSYQKPTP